MYHLFPLAVQKPGQLRQMMARTRDAGHLDATPYGSDVVVVKPRFHRLAKKKPLPWTWAS